MDIYGYSSLTGPSGWPVEVWTPPLFSVVVYTGYVYLGNTEKEFFGFIDCAYWCGELIAASEKLAERAAAIALVAGQPGQMRVTFNHYSRRKTESTMLLLKYRSIARPISRMGQP